MRQINFGLIFGFGLAMVYFTLENITSTNVQIVPGVSISLTLAALLLISAGLGAFVAWLFGAWIGMMRTVESQNSFKELEANQARMQELEIDISRYRSTKHPVNPSAFAKSNIQDIQSFDSNAA